MYGTFLTLHSIVRYAVLILLIVLIVKSLMGWTSKAAFTGADNKISLFTLIFTHTQVLLGLVLYFVSPFVWAAEKSPARTYWKFEHVTLMLIAVMLITVARATMKKINDGPSKHKRLFILNTIALVIVIAAIVMSGRGLFGMTV